MTDNNVTPPTAAEIERLVKHGKITSLKPFCMELDFTDGNLTFEEYTRTRQILQDFCTTIDAVIEQFPELLTGKENIESDETFIEFFTQLLSITQKTQEEVEEKPKALFVFDDKSAQFVPTLKKYMGALLPTKNKTAYIAKADKQLRFIWDENGECRIDVADEQTAFEELSNIKSNSAKDTDTDLLMTLAAAVEAAYMSNIGYIITVDLPSFARAMDVQFETEGKDQKQYDFKKKITDLENIIGVLVEEQKIQAAFKILDLDQHKKTLTFASPYLYSLMEIFNKERITTTRKKNNKALYSIKGVTHLISSRINSARNKVTAQCVYYLIGELHRHGIQPDAKREPHKQFKDDILVTKQIKYSDLIKNTPRLKEALKESEPKRRNQVLKRAVFGDNYSPKLKNCNVPILETYLREYTSAFNYWKDLTISFEPVSMKERDNVITFTHHGLNGNFEPELSIPHINTPDNLFEEN